MAVTVLTQQQWYDKIKRFLPSWYFETELHQKAHLMGLAKILSTFQQDLSNHIGETMILTAAGEFLDLHGDERSVPRITGESDDSYRQRIRVLANTVVYENLKALVDGVLANGESVLVENWAYGFYDDEDDDTALFFDATESVWIDRSKYYNWLTFIIPSQHGSDDSAIKAAIVEVIEYNKALGVTFDVIYGSDSLITEGGDSLITEDGDQIVL